jgi:multidrug efflux pump subunit AcrA (membrane-fusion protein)
MPVAPRLSDDVLFSSSERRNSYNQHEPSRIGAVFAWLKRSWLWLAAITALILVFNSIDATRRAELASRNAEVAELKIKESTKVRELRDDAKSLLEKGKQAEAALKQLKSQLATRDLLFSSWTQILRSEELDAEEKISKMNALIERPELVKAEK